MKVIMVVPFFPRLSETFIVSKFIGLLDQGIDAHIVCAGSPRSEWNHFPVLLEHPELRKRIHVNWPTSPHFLVAILFFPALISSFFIRPMSTFRYLKKGFKDQSLKVVKEFYLDRELIILQPDIIHYEFGASAVKKEYVKERLNCKLVASFRGHDIEFVGLDSEHYYDELWRQVNGVHFLGLALKKKAIARGFPESILHSIIPPAIDPSKYQPSRKVVEPFGQETIKILSVGRLHWVKGYEYALLAVKELLLRGHPFEYHIAGGGDGLASLAFCCHQLIIEEYVTFLGSISPEKVSEELKWADIFLHPAVEEGFGNAVIEAQAMQLPVVCSDAVGLPENVENGVTGFVVPRRDSVALADRLELLAKDSLLREKMGLAGRERVISKFQLKDQIQAFKALYIKILS